jgi:hypothetical protein
MTSCARVISLFVAGILELQTHFAPAQTATPPAGYYDIPPGFDFPADQRILEQYRSQPNVPGQRLHVWNVFSGLTSNIPDGQLAIFETWFAEDDAFNPNPATLVSARFPSTRRFQVPNQFRASPTKQNPVANSNVGAPGTAVLSFVLYNFAAYNHIRTNHLYQSSVLDALAKNGAPDSTIPQSRTIPPFPAGAVVLKLVWWPIAKDKISAMPIWDPADNPAQAGGNPTNAWARYIGVDPTPNRTVPDGEVSDVTFDGQVKHNAHIVGLNNFHHITINDAQAADVNSQPFLAQVAQQSFGRPLMAGDYAVLVAAHLTTKEISDWVWATFWWHDRPDEGHFAANRVGSIAGVWRNYLMAASYDLNLPSELDGGPHVAFNPWLEARFPDGGHGGGGTVSNCMNCHNRASWPNRDPANCPQQRCFLPVYRGNPDLSQDPQYNPGRLRTDFLWSIPGNGQ